MMSQFDWLCVLCGYVMSHISSIYRVDMGFINNYKESQLWLVILMYNADVANVFPWVVTYDIFGLLFFNMVGATHFLFNVHNHAPSTAYVTTTRNLLFVSYYTNYVTRLIFIFSFCDISIWLIMCILWECDESYIEHLQGTYGLY